MDTNQAETVSNQDTTPPGQEQWTAVDRYITDHLVPRDTVLEEALEANALSGLPSIDVAPNQGKLLYLLALMKGAKRILEVGTLGGYSTIWLARALPADGRLVTLELEPKHAEVARGNLERAREAEKVEIRVGAALDLLVALHEEGAEPFDLIFIDADKKRIPAYLEWSMKLAREGTLIVVDNVVREGELVNAASEDPDVQGVRAMFEMLAAEPRLSATAIQTVGSKKWDGFAMAVVLG
jgi:predicted O-methyltransferase YrrM